MSDGLRGVVEKPKMTTMAGQGGEARSIRPVERKYTRILVRICNESGARGGAMSLDGARATTLRPPLKMLVNVPVQEGNWEEVPSP